MILKMVQIDNHAQMLYEICLDILLIIFEILRQNLITQDIRLNI